MTKLFTPSNIEWLPKPAYSISPFIGCGAGCTYCWSRQIQNITPEKWKLPTIKPQFQSVDICNEIIRQSPITGTVLLCNTTDPLQDNLYMYTIMTCIILTLGKLPQLKVWVLTKGNVTEIINYMEPTQFRIGITLTSLEPNPYEPYAPSPEVRINGLKIAYEKGFRTFISLEPWIKDTTYPEAIIASTEQFCNKWYIGSHNYKMRAKNKEFCRIQLPALQDWIISQGLTDRVYIKKELLSCLD